MESVTTEHFIQHIENKFALISHEIPILITTVTFDKLADKEKWLVTLIVESRDFEKEILMYPQRKKEALETVTFFQKMQMNNISVHDWKKHYHQYQKTLDTTDQQPETLKKWMQEKATVTIEIKKNNQDNPPYQSTANIISVGEINPETSYDLILKVKHKP